MTRAGALALFARERARFARACPWVSGAALAIADRACTSPRHCRRRDLAYADVDTGVVTLLARALALPRANVVALLRHELGHLCDPDVDRPGAEQRADDIAEAVAGRRVAYDAADVQTTGRGAYPRPGRLPR